MSAKLSQVGDGGRSERWRRLLPSAAERAKLIRHPFLAGGRGRFASEAYSAPGSDLSRLTARFRGFLRAVYTRGPRRLYTAIEVKSLFNYWASENIPTSAVIAALILESCDVTGNGRMAFVWLSLKPECHQALLTRRQTAIAVVNAGLACVHAGCQTRELI
jgi:hypothetical protein